MWFLNEPLTRVPATSDGYIVRWERPHLIHIPEGLLHLGRNVLHLRPVVREFGEAQQARREEFSWQKEIVVVAPANGKVEMVDRC